MGTPETQVLISSELETKGNLAEHRNSALERGSCIELIDLYLSGKSPRTIHAYSQDLEYFRRYLVSVGFCVDGPAATSRVLLSLSHGRANAMVLGYRSHLMTEGKSPSTVNRRLSAIRALVKLAGTLGMVDWRLDVPEVKSQAYRDTSGPGADGVSRIFERSRSGGSPRDRRNHAAFRLLYDLALRVAEVVSLDLEHLDTAEGKRTLWVMGKGKTEREPMTLPPETVKALGAWIEARGTDPGPLFVNFSRVPGVRGERLTVRGLSKALKAVGRKVGVDTSPHGLRHSAITEALDVTDGDVRAAQRFSRHKDPRTLLVYDDNRRDLAGDVARLVASKCR